MTTPTGQPPQWNCKRCGYGEYIWPGDEARAERRQREHAAAHAWDAIPAAATGQPERDHAALLAKLERAHKELCEAVNRQRGGKPALRLSIPARPDHDTDLLIGAAITESIAALTSPAHAALLARLQYAYDHASGVRKRGLAEAIEIVRGFTSSPAERAPWLRCVINRLRDRFPHSVRLFDCDVDRFIAETDHAFEPSYSDQNKCGAIIEGATWVAADPIRCRRSRAEHAHSPAPAPITGDEPMGWAGAVDWRTEAAPITPPAERAPGETLAGIKAALTDESLSDGAKVQAALTYLGGLVEPDADDLAWASRELAADVAPSPAPAPITCEDYNRARRELAEANRALESIATMEHTCCALADDSCARIARAALAAPITLPEDRGDMIAKAIEADDSCIAAGAAPITRETEPDLPHLARETVERIERQLHARRLHASDQPRVDEILFTHILSALQQALNQETTGE